MSIQPRPKNPRDQKEIFSYCRKDRNTVPREGKRPSLWRSFPRKFVNFLAISLEDDGWPQNRRAETGVAFKQCGHLRMHLLTYLLTYVELANPQSENTTRRLVFRKHRFALLAAWETRAHSHPRARIRPLFSPLFHLLREKERETLSFSVNFWKEMNVRRRRSK